METAAFTRYRNSAIFNVEDESSYSTYWESIDNMIPAGSTVFLSGDGIYNQINLEMMMDEDGKYTIDKHQIILVSNTKDLLNTNTNKKTLRELAKDQEYSYVLCGNPEFYTDNSGRDIPSLPGAEKEVNEIAKILSTDKKTSVTLLNRMLTEEKLKEIENPSVFHIATHGYFKEGVDDEDNFASSALLNSGLLLYGSGDILADKENYNVNRKEGILTAYEASNLNFYTTELVVLSACETGRGEMRVGEGVYGLQRAFLVAGADAVIMSLFKVNDEVTQKLMVLFYQYWLESGNKRTAFIKAKRSIKQQYNNPLYWGAFVMIEGKPRK
ncbi:MAG: CHAT domain-containing protein [Cytophagaceae bacterium]